MGDEASWLRLASHLGLPLQEVKASTTSSDLVKWLTYLNDQETRPPDRVEHYLIQIAAELRALRYQMARKKKKVSFSEFELKFRFKSSVDTQATPLTADELEARRQAVSERDRRAWGAWLGAS